VRDVQQDKNVSVLPWPGKSPDFNPIEHVWDLLDRRVRARAIPPRNVQELAAALVEELGNISARTGKSGAVHEEEMHCST
jgi:transposase